jgi:hypothetical protein
MLSRFARLFGSSHCGTLDLNQHIHVLDLRWKVVFNFIDYESDSRI